MDSCRTFYDFMIAEDSFQLCLKLTRSICTLETMSLESLKLLFDMCPVVQNDMSCVLNVRSVSGLSALCLSLTESDFQHNDQIKKYLVRLLQSIRSAIWENPFGVSCRRGIIFPEFVGFLIGTVLTDLAVFCDEHRLEIVETVLSEFDYTYNYCSKASSLAVPEKEIFIAYYIPFIIGLLRSFARKSSTEDPLTKLLFLDTNPSDSSFTVRRSSKKDESKSEKEKTKTSQARRSITGYEARVGLILKAKRTQTNATGGGIKDAELDGKCAYELIDFNPASLFSNFGSSYPLLKHRKRCTSQLMDLDKKHLLLARNVCSNLLNENFLTKLDDGCEYYYFRVDKRFPYKSFSEIFSLSTMSMIKSMIFHSDSLDEELKRTFYDLVKVQYVLLNNTDIERKYASVKVTFSPCSFNPYYLFSKASAETTEVLVKVAEEESSEIILSKLHTRVSKTSANFNRYFPFEIPMFECALNCMGTLAEKFPSSQVAKIVVDNLKNFLLDPSVVLVSIYNLRFNSNQANVSAATDVKEDDFLNNGSSHLVRSLNSDLSNHLKVFSNLRDIAIANLCRALQAVFNTDKTIINAALATISAKSYSAADMRARVTSSHGISSETDIISRNCILILGNLALTQRQSFVANTDLMAKVLGIFQQMFSRDSAELDELIVDQMGYMVMVGPAGGPVWAPIPKDSIDSRSSTLAQSYWLDDNEYEGVSVNSGSNQVYQQIMKVFSTALCGVTAGTASVASGPGDGRIHGGANSGAGASAVPQFTFVARSSSLGANLVARSAAMSHVIPAVLRTISTMCACIRDPEHMSDFLLKLLTIFGSLGMSEIQIADKMSRSDASDSDVVKSRVGSGDLLASIAKLLDRMPEDFQPKLKLYKAFQQFWCVVSRLHCDDESKSSSCSLVRLDAIARIARKSPLLVSSEEAQNLKQIVDVDFKFLTDYTATEMVNMKNLLISRSKAKDEFALAINKIETCSQINFAFAVQTLESLRHKHAAIPSFRVLFQYFEELQQMKEGKVNNMWTVTKGICDFVFTIYLDTMKSQKKTWKYDRLLQEHAQYLLTKFNASAQPIRKQADHYLSQILDRFPNILWNYEFIKTSLEILEIQKHYLYQRQEGVSQRVTLSGTCLDLVIARTVEERQAILNDFTNRTKQFISESIKIAANTTRSHLMHYIDTKNERSCATASHPGLKIAMDFLVTHPKQEASNAAAHDQGNLASFMILRSKFLGEARGMAISLKELGKSPNELQLKYARNLLQDKNTDEAFINDLFRMSAMLIMCDNNSDVSFMLKAVCSGFLNHFTEQSVNNSIACWEWILSARNDLSLQLFMYICEAWHGSKDRKLGIFSAEEPALSPTTFTRGAEFKSNLPFVLPHNLLVQFFEQKFATFKFSDLELIDMLYNLIGRSLYSEKLSHNPNLTLESHPIMNRSLGAVGVRFRILSLGLHILHFFFPKIDSLDSAQAVYQKRIISCAFEYFTRTALPPTQSRNNLREDISALIDFFVLLRAEKTRVGAGIEEIKRREGGSKKMSSGRVELKYVLSKLLLLNLLVWTEIERLTIWFSPLKLPLDDAKFKQWPKLLNVISPLLGQTQQDKFWVEYTALAWSQSPELAVHLPSRFKQHPAIIRELRKLVRNYPQFVAHIAEAVDYLCSEMEDADSIEVMPILTWKHGSPSAALKLLYSTRSSYTSQHAIRVLQRFPQEVLVFFVPQLVQALRYDVLGYVKEFILWASKHHVILAHQFIWNLETNAYRDEDKKQKDGTIGDLSLGLVQEIKDNFTTEQAELYRKEFEFFADVTSISGKIRLFEKGPKRKEECQRLLKNIHIGGERRGCYLPTDPEAEVVGIDYTSGIPMQSAAKAPFLAKFFVRRCGLAAIENASSIAERATVGGGGTARRAHQQKERYDSDKPNSAIEASRSDTSPGSASGSSGPSGTGSGKAETYVQGCIFKVGDDCRQDMLCLQLIQLFENIFKSIGLDLYLCPYRVVATAPGCGVIECVPDSRTRDELGKTAEESLNLYFTNTFGEESSREYQEARRNFVISMAAYSVVGYLLQIKDRHNGNIMIDKYGHVIHIDFGFLFESSPGHNMNWEPDFKLSNEFVELMCAGAKQGTVGGKFVEPPFHRLFRELTVKGFLAVRPYHEEIITIVSLMLDTGLPCFRGQTIPKLRDRLKLNLSEREARDHMLTVIKENSKNIWSKTYDMIQALQNDIAYF